MSVDDVNTKLEALRYIHDSATSSFNTTLGFVVVAAGWLVALASGLPSHPIGRRRRSYSWSSSAAGS